MTPVNRATAESNMFVFQETTIKPLAALIADALTRQLARDFDPSLVVLFEDFITEDKQHRLAKRIQLLDRKVITINEVRADEGLDPVEWGDRPIGQMQDVAITPETLEPDPEPEPPSRPQEADDDDSEEDEDESARR